MNLKATLTARAETITSHGQAITINVEQLLGDASTPDLTALFCRVLEHARERKIIAQLRTMAANASYDQKP